MEEYQIIVKQAFGTRYQLAVSLNKLSEFVIIYFDGGTSVYQDSNITAVVTVKPDSNTTGL